MLPPSGTGRLELGLAKVVVEDDSPVDWDRVGTGRLELGLAGLVVVGNIPVDCNRLGIGMLQLGLAELGVVGNTTVDSGGVGFGISVMGPLYPLELGLARALLYLFYLSLVVLLDALALMLFDNTRWL